MDRRQFLTTAGIFSLAGCAGLSGGDEPSRLDLTVQNERAHPITAQVVVTDGEGTTSADEWGRIGNGVARPFDVPVGADGRHEATVSGDDWQGTLAWHADTCVLFDRTVRMIDDSIEVVSECVQQR
ncbi:hypothetical protein [Halobellus ordinarius]|uniref:hypothetical protein n=1 Tax=Halobellus ordinarius TaxID=3075120 RepID=UPI0028807071|nr:hypothetical protein [Halobellus sp. ZY16]